MDTTWVDYFPLSLFVQHLASVGAIEILTTWEEKSLKKECAYATPCTSFLISYSDREENSLNWEHSSLLEKVPLGVYPDHKFSLLE